MLTCVLIREREREKKERKKEGEWAPSSRRSSGVKRKISWRIYRREKEMREREGEIYSWVERAQVVGEVVVLGSLRTRATCTRQSDADRAHVDIDSTRVYMFVLARAAWYFVSRNAVRVPCRGRQRSSDVSKGRRPFLIPRVYVCLCICVCARISDARCVPHGGVVRGRRRYATMNADDTRGFHPRVARVIGQQDPRLERTSVA